MEKIWESSSSFILLPVYLNEKLFLQTFASMIPLCIFKAKSIEIETAGHFLLQANFCSKISAESSHARVRARVITPHLLWLPCFPNKKRSNIYHVTFSRDGVPDTCIFAQMSIPMMMRMRRCLATFTPAVTETVVPGGLASSEAVKIPDPGVLVEGRVRRRRRIWSSGACAVAHELCEATCRWGLRTSVECTSRRRRRAYRQVKTSQ